MDLRWIFVRSAFWGPVCFYIVNSGQLGLQSEALPQKTSKGTYQSKKLGVVADTSCLTALKASELGQKTHGLCPARAA